VSLVTSVTGASTERSATNFLQGRSRETVINMTVAQLQRNTRGGDDSVARYLDEIGQHALLTPAGERELAARIAAGRRARDELDATDLDAARIADGAIEPGRISGARLPAAQRRQLQATVADGRRASELFVNANLRLVVSVAKRYQASGVPLLDLIQEGNLGLLRAVQKFDHEKGFRFSTYAVWWIRQFVARGIAGSRASMKLPSRANDELLRLREMTASFEQVAGHAPSLEDLADGSGIPVDRVRDLLAAADVVSLQIATGPDGDGELGDLVADPRGQAEVESFANRLSDAETERMFAVLDDREREIIRMRFGFGGEEPTAVSDVSQRIGLSRERIRQLEHRAIAKLVHPSWNAVGFLR